MSQSESKKSQMELENNQKPQEAPVGNKQPQTIIKPADRKKRNSTTSLGRPKLHQPTIEYAQREHSIPVYSKWSEHKRTLIALQLQFCYDRASKQQPINKKDLRKYQCGFLSWGRQIQKTSTVITQDQLNQMKLKKIPQLLIRDRQANDKQHADQRDLADMVELAISIKHKDIAKEWCYVYDIICSEVLSQKGHSQQFIPEEGRRTWEKSITKTLMDELREQMTQKHNKFPCLASLLNESRIALQKLLMQEAYCLLAEYFNFRINEYFVFAFQPPPNEKLSNNQE